MIYLDYSATTPVDKEVVETFSKACLNYWANPNSLHNFMYSSNVGIVVSFQTEPL